MTGKYTHKTSFSPFWVANAQLHHFNLGGKRLSQTGVRLLMTVDRCCSVLQCVSACCSVLQCVAVCCSVLQHLLMMVDLLVVGKTFFLFFSLSWMANTLLSHWIKTVYKFCGLPCILYHPTNIKQSTIVETKFCGGYMTAHKYEIVYISTGWRRPIGCLIFIGHFL